MFSSRDIPGEVVDVLITRQETLDRYEGELAAFVAGWLNANNHFLDNPKTSAEVMAPREGLTPEEFLHAMKFIKILNFDDNRRLLTGNTPDILKTLQMQLDAINNDSEFQPAVDLALTIDGRFFRKSPP